MSKSSFKLFIVGTETQTCLEQLSIQTSDHKSLCQSYSTSIRHTRHGEWNTLCWVYQSSTIEDNDVFYLYNCDVFIITISSCSSDDESETLVQQWTKTIRDNVSSSPCFLLAGTGDEDRLIQIARTYNMDFVSLNQPDLRLQEHIAALAFHVVAPQRVPRLLKSSPALTPQSPCHCTDVLQRFHEYILKLFTIHVPKSI